MALSFATHYLDISDQVIDAMAGLISKNFGDQWPEPNFRERVRAKTKPMAVLALSEEIPVGFKLGHEKYQGAFYSWLGCVQSEHRRKGIARALLKQQHQWCKERGYEKVLTRSRNTFPGMMILNIQEGFRVTGTEMDGGEPALSILFSKSLINC